MKVMITTFLTLAAFLMLYTSAAQVNLKPLSDKGFITKNKFKPYKKTKNQILKLQIKNDSEKNQEINFQLFLYVDGVAESMSEQKNECLAPKKKVKYRFLFEPQNIGAYSVEFEKLEVKEVESCSTTVK